MDKQILIATLKKQHHALREDLALVSEALKVETRESQENIVTILARFKQNIIKHVALEDEKFYPSYFKKMRVIGSDVTVNKEFIREMARLIEMVINFLDAYNTWENIASAPLECKKQLKQITDMLNVRIEIEEETLYDIYLSLA